LGLLGFPQKMYLMKLSNILKRLEN